MTGGIIKSKKVELYIFLIKGDVTSLQDKEALSEGASSP